MNEQVIARYVRIFGIVQAVGFRPAVSRHAAKHKVHGTVCNKGSYVEIYVHGSKKQVEDFLTEVKDHPPKRSVILKIDVEEAQVKEIRGFHIVESEKKQGEIFVSPDIAICPECKKELFDPKDRRYLHPFINCTCCGPRLTIMDAVPYDRERTSMKEFPMCEECEWEYTHSETRRYDAQPVCCNDCGPEVYIPGTDLVGKEAITKARHAIMEGKIIAVKGIGGFHLCCDALNEKAVSLLRTRKRRPVKPFAVMFRDMDVAKRECKIDQPRKKVLDGHQKPIILMERTSKGKICKAVAPGNPKIGGMLPYTPLHLLLFQYDDEVSMTDALVMTSANTSGTPICKDNEEAVEKLLGLCDLILSHNRLIRLRADDSVMDFYEGKPYMVRRSRGYAPVPFMMKGEEQGAVLAMGGELKNTFCLGKNQLYYPSPYIADMSDLRSVKVLKESIERMKELLECEPQMVACDLHPRYNTTFVAEELNLPVIKVQHHYAHVLSCMAENNYSEKVIGVAFDGTGWGDNQTVWGGEFLVSDLDGYERMGSMTPFTHVGGDLASREGWRIGVSYLHDLYPENGAEFAKSLALCTKQEYDVISRMSDRKINAVTSTSMGRLFDAASAILGICKASTFEGEASCALEYAAARYEKETQAKEKPFVLPCDGEEQGVEEEKCGREKEWAKRISNGAKGSEQRFLLPTHDLIKEMINQKLQGRKTEQIAYEFHESVAAMMTGMCLCIREKTGLNTVALSGGVYQNQLLLKLSIEKLEREGFRVLRHSLIPPNDGGICLGQARKAMYELNKGESICV